VTGRRALLTALALTFAGAVALPPAGVFAQALGVGPVIQTYRFDEPEVAGVESLRLVTVPWSGAVPIGSSVAVSVSGAWAEGRATGPSGGEATLSGLTDTNLGVSLALGDWLVVTADATLATGKSTLSLEERLVAGVVAADLLPFAINTWGSGRSAGGTVAMATQAGPWGVGFAAGYRVASEFEPLPSEPLVYNPGDQLQARLAIDRDIGGSSTLSIVAGYQRFSDDQLQGANLFRAGNRIEGTVSLAFPLGLRSSALVYGGVNHRSRGTLLLDESQLSAAGDSPSQQLFLAGANVRMPLGRRAALLPAGELRVFRASDGASQGWVGSAGTALDLRLTGNSSSRRLVLSPSGALRLGNVIVEQGAEAGFSGWEAGLVLRVEGGR